MSKDSLLLAATNHEKLLDSAVWRRFDYKLEVELPDKEALIQMIDLFIGKAINLSMKQKVELATIFEGLSGADVEEILKKSMRNAVIHDKELSVECIFEEFFTFKNIIPQNCINEKSLLETKAKYLRSCNEKVFSLQIIADILNKSKTTIAKIVKEEES